MLGFIDDLGFFTLQIPKTFTQVNLERITLWITILAKSEYKS